MRDPFDPIRIANLRTARERVPLPHDLVVDEVRNGDLRLEKRKKSEQADLAEVDQGSGVCNDDHDIGLSSRSSSESSKSKTSMWCSPIRCRKVATGTPASSAALPKPSRRERTSSRSHSRRIS